MPIFILSGVRNGMEVSTGNSEEPLFLDTPLEHQLHKPNGLWEPGRIMGESPDTHGSLTGDNFGTPGGASSQLAAALPENLPLRIFLVGDHRSG
jgi:hypothetical protein